MPFDAKRLCLLSLLLGWVATAAAQDTNQTLRERALAGDTQAVGALLREEAPELDAADEAGWTALMYAVKSGHEEIVEMLLKAGAGVHPRNQSQETALHLAARHGRTGSAELLLRKGADFGVRDSEGRTPLYRAIENGRTRIIEMLQGLAAAQGNGAPSRTTSESRDPALPPQVVKATKAQYTESARAKGVEGTVVLMVLVRRDGSVGAARVSEGLEASLDQAALRAVREWKFSPAMRNMKTVEIVVEVRVEFQLPSEPSGSQR